MNPVRFIRTMHNNGQMRSFPREAWQFWYSTGGIVGELVRPETPMTLAEIAAACREAAFDTIADGPHPEMDETYVAWCLVKLIEYGMVAPVLPSTATETSLSWDALLPASAQIVIC